MKRDLTPDVAFTVSDQDRRDLEHHGATLYAPRHAPSPEDRQRLREKERAASAKVQDLRSQIQALETEAGTTEWVLTTASLQRNGESRDDAQRRRARLFDRVRVLSAGLPTADREHRELFDQVRDLDRLERIEQLQRLDTGHRTRYAAIQRADRLLALESAMARVHAADASVVAARADAERQQDRLSECDAAEEAVASSHQAMVEAQAQTWLNRNAETEAREREAIAAHRAALQRAAGAVAARPLLTEELALAQGRLAAAHAETAAARSAWQTRRVELAQADWNSAVASAISTLQPALNALREMDASSAKAVGQPSLAVFNYLGNAEAAAGHLDRVRRQLMR